MAGRAFFGRADEIQRLHEAWENPDVHVISVAGWGGIGKSALVKHWLLEVEREDYACAECIFAWSFARQGLGDPSSSAEDFTTSALAWFGDVEPARGTAWGKGERLANLVREQRTLLLLDGLEPLQYPTGNDEGKLKDESLQALLRELAAYNQGLCVLTSRLPVADLEDYESTTALRIDLGELKPEAGAEVLRAYGAVGDEEQLHRAVNEFDGHPLGLTLLGSYLRDAYHGDIERRDQVALGRQAESVMAAYEHWFGSGAETELLHVLGLFDRSTDESAVAAVRASPPIPGLTETLHRLNLPEWRRLVSRLRRAKLIVDEDPSEPTVLDVHPLVREHFREQLKARNPVAWREGNRRLYEHYKRKTKSFVGTLADMEPLFQAVGHGCNAGRHRDVLHEVYLPLIVRGEPTSTARRLGAYSTLVSALANFCEDGDWGRPVEPAPPHIQGLDPADQLTVLSQAGLFLTSIKGYAASEVRACYDKVHELSYTSGQPTLLYSVLISQWRHSMVTAELNATLQLAEEVHALAQRHGNPALKVGAYRALCVIEFYLGNLVDANTHAREGVRLWEAGAYASPVNEVYTPVITCLCVEALVMWHTGELANARSHMDKAIQLARELSDFYALAAPALLFSCYLDHFRRDFRGMEAGAEELIQVSASQGFKLWLATGLILQGYALGITTDTERGLACLRKGMQQFLMLGAGANMSYFISLEAEILLKSGRPMDALAALERGFHWASRFAEGWWAAELHRLKGETLRMCGRTEAEVQKSLLKAVEIASAIGSKTLELRALCSLVRAGGGEQARSRLIELYIQYPHDFDAPDLKDACSWIEHGK